MKYEKRDAKPLSAYRETRQEYEQGGRVNQPRGPAGADPIEVVSGAGSFDMARYTQENTTWFLPIAIAALAVATSWWFLIYVI